MSQWEKVKKELYNRIGTFEIEEINSSEKIGLQVAEALKKGETRFIAAGGDGTVNLLLNAIMDLSDNPNIIIGAVGLGSSNDFHKPFRSEAFIKGISLKVDFKNAFLCDVIRIDYLDLQGSRNIRFCLINASMGVTAEGNAIFNSQHRIIKFLQRISIEAATITSALMAIFTYRNIPCSLTLNNGEEHRVSITNLGIIKNPHFTGSLCYDTPIKPDDGKLGVNLCIGLSIPERISLLIALHNHRFQGRPKTKSWIATKLSVKSDQIFALEMDGEVIHTNNAEFNILPKRVKCCL